MKLIAPPLIALIIFGSLYCTESKTENKSFQQTDSTALISMIHDREKAMIDKTIDPIAAQFDSNAVFINGGGFYYEGIKEIADFHDRMFHNDSLTYSYKIGNIKIKAVNEKTAIVYYPWQQDWTMKNIVSDTFHEIGLMTIIAEKNPSDQWKWKAITNQRTKEFFPDLEAHKEPSFRK